MSRVYDAAYTPPFPILDVILMAPGGPRALPVAALIDTGADITLAPLATLEQVAAWPFASGLLRSQWGERRPVDLYLLDVQVGALTFPGIEVAGDEHGRDMILGRNALNKLSLFLDGPRQQSEVLDDAVVMRLRTRHP